jgi:hypothetical protein
MLHTHTFRKATTMHTADEIIDAARVLGFEHGTNAGSWVIDGNTSDETRSAIARGFYDGDPAVMDLCPNPLQVPDVPTVPELIEESGLVFSDLDSDDLRTYNDVDRFLNAYECAFSEGFWSEVIRSTSDLYPLTPSSRSRTVHSTPAPQQKDHRP